MNKKNSCIGGSGAELYEKAKKLIPGGTQLLSKRPEMFAPDLWPAYYNKAKGSKVWDLDDKKFLDMSIMAVGACILGYADDDVDSAVIDAIRSGVSSSLNCSEEITLANLLLELHPWFDMVRYARSGGEAMSVAIRIARAKTNRDIVLFSGYHGWADWYLAANLSNRNHLDGQLMPGLDPLGVPRGLAGTSIPFDPNDLDSLRKLLETNKSNVAAIVIEPARGADVDANFLKNLREISLEFKTILIFDEITTGFRICSGGIHRKYGIYPDIAVFAKSISNGYPMSVVVGTSFVMEAAQSTFISSTNWTDRMGPTAAIATIEKYKKNDVATRIISLGKKVKNIWKNAAEQNGIKLKISGIPSLPSFAFESAFSNELNTRFVSELLHRNILGFRQFKPSFAHSDIDLENYEFAINEVFKILATLPEDEIISTPVAHSGFYRLTPE